MSFLLLSVGTMLFIDGYFHPHYLSKDLNMRANFIVFAILLILGMIQVKGA